ncbi:Cytochrome c [Rubripirellula lacrimiformis]|uniref:Cytochrome c n=1 Tax=Rubripirellula lacrimiformis TaxID=1930273 RepID=A0A517NAF0_9BACT|nr:DUF6797 domain-containing protein [Rubripirellula lacrimiformis]QDT04111.1 Cytochrome c [Rubripirellula lacrimiformis]
MPFDSFGKIRLMTGPIRLSILCVLVAAYTAILTGTAGAETLRHPPSLLAQLESSAPADLAADARRRGDAKRGAVVFFKSSANCVGCHSSGDEVSPLGPNLAALGPAATDAHWVDALLKPSLHIRKGFETYSLITVDGNVHTGMLADQSDESVTLRLAQDLNKDFIVDRDDIEVMKKNSTSMMPDGIVASLKSQREFLDLVRYVMEVADGGIATANQLRPSADDLAVKDDSLDLDHAGILQGLRSNDFDAGKLLFHGDCSNCHGNDGNTPSLATARAFGTQKLKFGSDPYRMFMTLTKGNGLMAPMSYLSPKQRYQVVHYIREAFMKDRNDDFFTVDKDYLASLPEGTKDGTEVELVERDFGPAVASQLRRDYASVLNIRLGETTAAVDLHTMDVAEVWSGDFLDLSQTQHSLPRGEGTANPAGESIESLSGWRWGHADGGTPTIDYSQEGLLPRGPLPAKWMQYHGHYLHGSDVVLSYSIDGREILERLGSPDPGTLIHDMAIEPGGPLVLCVGSSPKSAKFKQEPGTSDTVRIAASAADGSSMLVRMDGDIGGIRWEQDEQSRLVLSIAPDDQPRQVRITVSANPSPSVASPAFAEIKPTELVPDLKSMTEGGPLRWPETIHTVGYLGLEKSGYALDTLSLPDSTPSNTWFRTSGIDFFSDGRMAVSTHGGDIWIVSGIDETLLDLRWKRFAAGLYEPMGVKVVGEDVFVTCKDRLVRLRDVNGNGEADFYNSFSADTDVSTNFHAFNFDLQVDDEGNFYYAKSGHGADFSLPGAVWKISPDGSQREVVSTGFRSPNGMGSMPGGRLTVSDNQGQWMPASKINLVRKGAFFGWVPTYNKAPYWAPDGGKIDIDAVVPPKSFDQPLVWMPQEFDNSSGGEIWVDDPRFGPLANHLLHTSFGKGWMSYLMIQDVGETSQAAIIKLPLDFVTGIMRGNVNPHDGQVYAAGLQGWNGGGRAGLADGGIQRVRYTGVPPRMITDARVTADGIELDFNFQVSDNCETTADAFSGLQWNYKWSKNYGSDQYDPRTDQPGTQQLEIHSVQLSADGKQVRLNIPDIRPVDQLRLLVSIEDARGDSFDEEIYWTIHAIPGASATDTTPSPSPATSKAPQ